MKGASLLKGGTRVLAAEFAKVAVPDPYELESILLNEVIAKADEAIDRRIAAEKIEVGDVKTR